MAQETAFKSQGYLVQAYESAQKTGKLEHHSLLSQASAKHLSILEQMMDQGGDVNRLERALELNKQVLEQSTNSLTRNQNPQTNEDTPELIDEIFPAEFAR